MAEENKNNVPEQEEKTTEVQDRGLFDFMKKKEEVKPQETTTKLSSEFDNKTQISVKPDEEEEHKENKPTLVEQLHEKHEEEEEKKPSLLHKLHRSNSSSSSSSDEEGEDGAKKKKEKKKIVEGDVKTEEGESKGIMDKIKEKLPGHAKKPEDSSSVETETPVSEEHAAEKKGFMEKIKEKLPGHHHDKTNGEEEMKEKKSD